MTFTQTLNSSCYWPDINYYDEDIVDWRIAEHASRGTTILQALTVNGSTVQNYEQLLIVLLMYGWLMTGKIQIGGLMK